jgi:predicted RNA polymerase sigma factor
LLHAVLGEFKMQLNLQQEAAEHLKKALELAPIKSEQVFLQEMLNDCESALAEAV